MSAFRCAVIILAAGASRRMGAPKLLLPWGNTSILGHLIWLWKRLQVSQIAVVLAPNDSNVSAELNRIGFPAGNHILNPTPERGMFSSILCAAAWPGWLPDLTHFAIVLGDQPHLRPATLRALLDFSAAHPGHISQPSHGARPRHPVILPATFFRGLPQTDCTDLKRFLESNSSHRLFCEIDDPGLDLDIDQPADYKKALRLFLSS